MTTNRAQREARATIMRALNHRKHSAQQYTEALDLCARDGLLAALAYVATLPLVGGRAC